MMKNTNRSILRPVVSGTSNVTDCRDSSALSVPDTRGPGTPPRLTLLCDVLSRGLEHPILVSVGTSTWEAPSGNLGLRERTGSSVAGKPWRSPSIYMCMHLATETLCM